MQYFTRQAKLIEITLRIRMPPITTNKIFCHTPMNSSRAVNPVFSSRTVNPVFMVLSSGAMVEFDDGEIEVVAAVLKKRRGCLILGLFCRTLI